MNTITHTSIVELKGVGGSFSPTACEWRHILALAENFGWTPPTVRLAGRQHFDADSAFGFARALNIAIDHYDADADQLELDWEVSVCAVVGAVDIADGGAFNAISTNEGGLT